VIELWRIHNLDLAREMLTLRGIYESIGDDYTPPVEQFKVNEDARIWYVAAASSRGLIGMFSLMPQSRVCWELHVVMLPWAMTSDKWSAARTLPAWLERNTECRRLTAAVPANNGPAIVYGTHGIGMKCVGRHSKAFMKGGKLQDLVLLGLSIGN
jgi:hypothetical protein